mgnify:CR=1 FL=1
MDYGQIVSQGWKITWENKYLWVLGFLAALTSSRSNSSSNYSNNVNPETFDPEQLALLGGAMVAVICFAMVIGLILWVVGLVARGGLITAVYKISNGKQMTLGQAFSAGTERIWSLIGMNLLLAIPTIIFIAIVFGFVMLTFVGAGAAAFQQGAGGSGSFEEMFGAGLGLGFVFLMLLCCVFIIVAIVINFINAFAYRGIMIHKMGVMQSISHSWNLLNKNFGEVLALSILFGLIGIGFSMLVAMIFVPIALVVMAPVIAGSVSGDLSAGTFVYMMGAGLCLGVFGALITSILVTWQSATFTLAYKEWTKKMGFTYTDDLDDLDDIIEKAPA